MQSNIQELIENFTAHALNQVVILKEIENINVTEYGFDKGGLVDKSEKYKRGVIMSMGPLCPFDERNTIKVGDTVIYDGYKTSDLTLDGEGYKTLYYSDLVVAI